MYKVDLYRRVRLDHHHEQLRQEGFNVNVKVVERLYRQEGVCSGWGQDSTLSSKHALSSVVV